MVQNKTELFKSAVSAINDFDKRVEASKMSIQSRYDLATKMTKALKRLDDKHLTNAHKKARMKLQQKRIKYITTKGRSMTQIKKTHEKHMKNLEKMNKKYSTNELLIKQKKLIDRYIKNIK